MVLAHKEQGRLALARPLGRLLAVAVSDVVVAPAAGIDLVPVPSHPAVVRERGQDPLLRIARAASAELRRTGADARVQRLLRVPGRRPGDQAGLDAAARAANLAGRFSSRGTADGGRCVVLVDDVITTGATLREAQRALEEVEISPVGAATVAATHRRRPSSGPRLPVTGAGG